MEIILASQSPRRKQLLGYLVPEFKQISADIDETVLPNETPKDYVERLASQKAMTVFNDIVGPENVLVIGSDTTVVYQNKILGKPESLQDCHRILGMLSGQHHQVLTGFSVITKSKTITQTVVTDVEFTDISAAQIDEYWATNEPQDKAGAYAIQGIGGKFVKAINGSVSAVVGLPLVELDAAIKEVQIL